VNARVITIEYLIPEVYAPDGVPVSQGYRSGIGWEGGRKLASLRNLNEIRGYIPEKPASGAGKKNERGRARNSSCG
jgi:hypothetical protein